MTHDADLLILPLALLLSIPWHAIGLGGFVFITVLLLCNCNNRN
jgi:hypothetical protein